MSIVANSRISALRSALSSRRQRRTLALFLVLSVAACAQPVEGPDETERRVEVMRAEDLRPSSFEQLQPILAALEDEAESVRFAAVRALGRLENPAHVETIAASLRDAAPRVRVAAVEAMAQASRDETSATTLDALGAALVDRDRDVRAAALTALGRLRQLGSETLTTHETVLRQALLATDPRARRAAARGLAAFARTNSEYPLAAATVEGLFASALHWPDADVDSDQQRADLETARYATSALVTGGHLDNDPDRATGLAAHPDVQVRRQAARAAIRSSAAPVTLARALASDPEAAVRYEAVRSFDLLPANARTCALGVSALDDVGIHVRLAAIDAVAQCDPGHATLAAHLAQLSSHEFEWHEPARALTSLARSLPERAAAALPEAVRHPAWQVRAYAADAARTLDDHDVLAILARDANDNVRNAAIRHLAEAGAIVVDTLREALQRNDYQLLITTARAARNHVQLLGDVVDAMDRITTHGRDTSRDARMALLATIEELGDHAIAARVEPYLRDFDPAIADRAAEILGAWTGTRPPATPTERTVPAFPSAAEIIELDGAEALVTMRGRGQFTIRMLPFEAPTNALRFARQARAGHFDGLTFHRVVPGFVIQGGSRGANEYAGADRYTRDEITARSHSRGTVGISTRGRDTGDGQIFINLVDNARLDFDYTLFGEIVDGLETVDAIREGDVIESITIR